MPEWIDGPFSLGECVCLLTLLVGGVRGIIYAVYRFVVGWGA